jgi:ATP-dependent Clp protease adaptor protein ClpS
MKQKEKLKSKKKSKDQPQHMLVLHNDDVNTFGFVIESLVNVCQHDALQAEQCALVTHYQGRCDILRGPVGELTPLQQTLNSKGLIVTID